MEMSYSIDNLRILDLVRKYASNISSLPGSSPNSTGASDSNKSTTPIHNTISADTKLNIGNQSNLNNLGTQSSNALTIAQSNLLISGSGTNSNLNQMNTGTGLSLPNTLPITNTILSSDTNLVSPIVSMQASLKSNENYKNMIRALDFCYSDEPNAKFTIIDAINLCVTVVAYAANTHRVNQMLVILDVIIPLYLEHFKSNIDKSIDNCKSSGFMMSSDKMGGGHYQQEIANHARAELASILKVSVAIKTLANNTDFLARTYTGPRMDMTNLTHKTSTITANKSSTNNRSPSIMPDEDSARAGGEDKRGKQQHDVIDEKQIKHEFRSPRDFLLNVVSEFIYFSSKRIKDLYKVINDTSIKLGELLDTKAHSKLVEIAHALLKLWDDSITLNGRGIQK